MYDPGSAQPSVSKKEGPSERHQAVDQSDRSINLQVVRDQVPVFQALQVVFHFERLPVVEKLEANKTAIIAERVDPVSQPYVGGASRGFHGNQRQKDPGRQPKSN